MHVFLLLYSLFLCSAEWEFCANTNSIKGGSCNNPDSPCEPGSGDFNAGRVDSLEACESLCEKNNTCHAVEWHSPSVRGWGKVCVLQTIQAWKTEHQSGHNAACLKSDSFPNCKCSASPTPAPPTPGPTIACLVKKVAYLQADKVLGGRGNGAVYVALDLAGCPNVTEIQPQPYPSITPVLPSPRGSVFYVSASNGNDKNPGTQNKPFLTLQRAQQTIRALSMSSRPGSIVNIMQGTYYIKESLVFTSADSGSKGHPVTWQSDKGAKVVISGGQRLNCDWKPVTMQGHQVYSCTTPSNLDFSALYVNGVRQVRARFPNGNPLIPKDGYTGGAKAAAHWKPVNQQLLLNTFVYGTTGKLLSKGSSFPLNTTIHINVTDTEIPRTVGNCKQSQTLYTNTRFNETFNTPFWDTTSTSAVTMSAWKTKKWAKPRGAVVKMYHPNGWGSWAFEVDSFDTSSGLLNFSKGGFQEARGSSGTGNMYIENVQEELDAPMEWFHDQSSNVLYFLPDTKVISPINLSKAIVEIAQLKRVIQFRGEYIGSKSLVHDIAFIGVNITHAAPTYLDSYEVPSGGDWSIHRGGAVFIDSAERIDLQHMAFDQVGGNAVFLSNYVRNCNVLNCDFWRTGDTAIAVVGSTRFMSGTQRTFPAFNTIQGNWIDTVGVNMKQTSCYFKAITYSNTIKNNICYNGPRAGINFNDGFMGGDLLEGNVIFNMVRETGDHGTFNSWDRREWFYSCDDDETTGKYCFTPKMMNVTHNMFIGPAGWNMDHDDGSSQYFDSFNIVYQGHFKYRDGVNRNMTGNLMLQATPVFQVTGFDKDFYYRNIHASTGTPICGPDTIGGLSGNVYLTIEGVEVESDHLANQSITHPLQKCDPGTKKTVTMQQLEDIAKQTIRF